jgi:hypothetical protein
LLHPTGGKSLAVIVVGAGIRNSEESQQQTGASVDFIQQVIISLKPSDIQQ